MSDFDADVEDLVRDADTAAKQAEEYEGLMQAADKLRGVVAAAAKDHAKSRKRVAARIRDASASGTITESQAASLLGSLEGADLAMQEAARIRPETGSLFVRLFLGAVNVKVGLSKDRQKLKDEYNKFKGRTNWLFLIIPMSWLLNIYVLSDVLDYTHWITIFGHVWLLYYYVSLALRENILRVNGSRILSWWIIHHYVSAGMSVVMLTWPLTTLHADLLPLFTAFFFFQAVIMHFQAFYQSRRHYSLVAQGKATQMDVTNPEGLREYNTAGILVVLVVLLALNYMFQFYISYSILAAAFTRPDLNVWQNPVRYKEELQVLVIGVAFSVLGIGNAVSLALTVGAKLFKKAAAKASGPAAEGGAAKRE